MENLKTTNTSRAGSRTAFAPPTSDLGIRHQASGIRFSRKKRGYRGRTAGTSRPSTPSFPRKRESTHSRKRSVDDGGLYRALDTRTDQV